jgi:hypothetical protein
MNVKRKIVYWKLVCLVIYSQIKSFFFQNLKDMIESLKVEANEQTKEKLKSILTAFMNALPDDVRTILAANHQKF